MSEPLHPSRIAAGLTPACARLLARLEVLASVDSTNAHLLRLTADGRHNGVVCLAERQTAGRGRRGRRWVSPPGGNLYLSVLWHFDLPPRRLGNLGLTVGVAVAKALHGLGADMVGLKWPNDLLAHGRKLGGILSETGSAAPGWVVTGVGLNVAMPAEAEDKIDQPWIDLHSLLGPCDRNAVAAQVLNQLLPALEQVAGGRDFDWLEQWSEFDLCAGRAVVVKRPDASIEGIARGIDPDGALQVQTARGLETFASAEVSLRMTP